MNGIVICSYQTETVGHLIGLTLRTSYPIFMKLQTTWSVFDTADTEEFNDITSPVPPDFFDEFGEFIETLMNENNMEMPHAASSAFDLYLYLLSKTEEYSQTALNVFNFAIIYQIAKLNTPEIINILFSKNLILWKCKHC